MCERSTKVSIIFLLSSVLALTIAFISEYFFNMLPCKLCVYERIIFCIVILIAVLHLFLNNRIFIYMMLCSYIIGLVISFYHIGLEHHWFYDVLGCTEQISENISLETLKNNLLNPNYSPSCDKPYYLLGISLATWNFIYLLGTLFLLINIYRKKK